MDTRQEGPYWGLTRKSRLLCPWDSPGSAGVGCHLLLQGIFLTQGWISAVSGIGSFACTGCHSLFPLCRRKAKGGDRPGVSGDLHPSTCGLWLVGHTLEQKPWYAEKVCCFPFTFLLEDLFWRGGRYTPAGVGDFD